MKKYNWLALLLMGASIASLIGYKFWDSAVTDSTPPEISVEEGVLQTSVLADRAALLQGVTARDDRDGDVTGSVVVESVGGVTGDGQATVWYAAFDHSGNVARLNRTIQYTDYERPRFTLKAPLLFSAGSSFDVVDLMGAWDALDGDITHRVRATSLSEQALSDAGSYEILFQVTNSMGDTRNLTLTAELYPSGSYNSELYLTDYLIYLPLGTRFDPEDYLHSFRYSVNQVDLTGRVPGGYDLDISGTVDVKTPGIYEVDYTLSCTLGNQTYTGRSRLAVIVEE